MLTSRLKDSELVNKEAMGGNGRFLLRAVLAGLLLVGLLQLCAVACWDPPPPPECEDDGDCDSCEECVDGECETCSPCCSGACRICGGDPNKHCCYGTCCSYDQWCCLADHLCHDECVDTEPTGHCDVDNGDDYPCPGCAGGILGPHCMDVTFREYTGNINHGCTGGCPGECARQDDVLCYTEYKCREEPLIFGVCGSEEGAPGGVACQPGGEYWYCIPCKKDASFEGEDVYVIHHACGYW